MQVFYLFSGELTVMAHASLFSNLTPFMLVLIRYVKREKINRLENFGTFIALMGYILTI